MPKVNWYPEAKIAEDLNHAINRLEILGQPERRQMLLRLPGLRNRGRIEMDVYGIHNVHTGTTRLGMSREEMYSYMECDAAPGELPIRKQGKTWYYVVSGHVAPVKEEEQ